MAASVWAIPDRGTGTPDFTLPSSSSSQPRRSSLAISTTSHSHSFKPRLDTIPSSSTLILTPAPRHGTQDGITLNNDSPPLSPSLPPSRHQPHNSHAILPLWQPPSSASSSPPSPAPSPEEQPPPSQFPWWNPRLTRSQTPTRTHSKRRHAVILTTNNNNNNHSRRRSEHDSPLFHAFQSHHHHQHEQRTLLHRAEEEEEVDDDEEEEEEHNTLLPAYNVLNNNNNNHHHLLAPPRPASAAASFWRPASAGAHRHHHHHNNNNNNNTRTASLSPSPAPSTASSTSAASSSHQQQQQPAYACHSAPPRSSLHLLSTSTPFASFFGLRERPRRIFHPPSSPSHAAPSQQQQQQQHASSSSSFFGALYPRRRDNSSNSDITSPCSPTAAISSTSALGSRFRWRTHRRTSPTAQRTSSPPHANRPRTHQYARLDKHSINWAQRALPYLPALIALAAIFLVSTSLVVFALGTLPVRLPPLAIPSPNVLSTAASALNGTSDESAAAAAAAADAAAIALAREHSDSITYRLTHLTLDDIRAVTASLKEYARTGKAIAENASLNSGGGAGTGDVDELVAGPLGLGFAKLHVLLVLSALFTWKQAFTIPGSIIMNVIFGALYGTFWGTVYTSLLTAFGGLCCYLLCSPLGGLIAALPGLKKPLHAIRTALDPDSDDDDDTDAAVLHARAHAAGAGVREDDDGGLAPSTPDEIDVEERSAALGASPRLRRRPDLLHRTSSIASLTTLGGGGSGSGSAAFLPATSAAHWYSLGSSNTWSYLLLLRLLPVVPYGLTNIACSVLRTPVLPFLVTLGLGSVPWNVLTCQVGELLEEVLSVALEVAASSTSASASASPATAVDASQGAVAGVKAIVGQVLWKRETMLKLGLVSLASLAPVVLGRLLRAGSDGPRAPSSAAAGASGTQRTPPSSRRGVVRSSFSLSAASSRPYADEEDVEANDDGGGGDDVDDDTAPLLEMGALHSSVSTPAAPATQGHGDWTSSATAPLHPLIRPPPTAAPAPAQHRPWWLVDDGGGDADEAGPESVRGSAGSAGSGSGLERPSAEHARAARVVAGAATPVPSIMVQPAAMRA